MALILETDNSKSAITDMAKTAGFEDADQANVEELFQSHARISNEKSSGSGERTK